MARYVIRPKSWVEDEEAWDYPINDHVPTVSDHEPIDTGLLDSNGNRIMRMPRPIGFGRDSEW